MEGLSVDECKASRVGSEDLPEIGAVCGCCPQFVSICSQVQHDDYNLVLDQACGLEIPGLVSSAGSRKVRI